MSVTQFELEKNYIIILLVNSFFIFKKKFHALSPGKFKMPFYFMLVEDDFPFILTGKPSQEHRTALDPVSRSLPL